ncbi:MAG: sodium:alanine symporter family protein [Clostridia bacterium]|nr:sodium:alanine symporter family protein [Clostridia bacterium]
MKFNPLVIIVTLTGAYLLIRLRFFFLLHPVRTAGYVLKGLKRKETARALFLALSGTLGVGNVVGVAVGIITGGAGSVFWMLVSTLFAAALKYGEVTLATDGISRSEEGVRGGIHTALCRFFGRLGGMLALIYSTCTVLLSFFMGATLQSSALVGGIGAIFDTPPTVIAIILAFFVLFSVVFGTRVIEKITAVVIPLTTIVYIILTLSVVFVCKERLPDAVTAILRGAFTARGAFGGALGFLFSRAVSEGFSRGLLSNEAGAGTSSAAHARGSSLHPAMCGLMGIAEVVFDTTLLCSLTALAILCAVPNTSLYTDGISLVYAAVLSLGAPAGAILAFCICAFAFSTVICWYFYGTEAYYSLFGRRSAVLLPIYLAFVLLGSRLSATPVIFVTDVLLLIMTAITSLLLIKKSDRICTLSEGFGLYGGPKKIFKLKGSCARRLRQTSARSRKIRPKKPRSAENPLP